jgi:hypothetical protein
VPVKQTRTKKPASAADSEGYDRKYDKNYDKHDGKLEKGFFHAALGAVNRIGLAEYTAEAAALDLEQGQHNHRHGDDYLGNV